jgi:hypothetical protein
MQLTPAPRQDNITSKAFREEFLSENKPLIFRSFAKDWPAIERWNFDYLKEKYGHVNVPLYLNAFAENGGNYLAPERTVPFAEYIDMLQNSDSRYRMFLFNILKNMPGLCDDFFFPDYASHFVKSNPFVFFGNAGSSVDAHFDADLSHVFLTHFGGKKTVMLFSPKYNEALYRHPLTVSTNVDIGQPDFERYPALRHIEGYLCHLIPGDTLFIPSGWWHYIRYDEASFSLSLRALSDNWLTRAKGLLNIAKLLLVDKNITRMMGGKRWYAKKERWAKRRAQRSGYE